MADKKFDEAEFLRTVERVAEGTDQGGWEAPRFDPQVAKDARDDKLRGNTIERYKAALSNLGFLWLPRHAIGTWADGSPIKDTGMWAHPDPGLQITFTETDILDLFPGDEGPKEFYEFVTEQKRRLAARRAGLAA